MAAMDVLRCYLDKDSRGGVWRVGGQATEVDMRQRTDLVSGCSPSSGPRARFAVS